MSRQDPVKTNQDKDSEQENLIKNDLSELLENKLVDIIATKNILEKKLSKNKKKYREVEQEKFLAEDIFEASNKKISKQKKYYMLIAMAAIVSSGATGQYLFLNDSPFMDSSNIQSSSLKSNYVIQNLKGDVIDTWLSWRITEDDVLRVNFINADQYPDKVDILKEVILSTEVIEVDNSLTHKGPKGTSSLYYLGWAGALKDASNNPTQLVIPSNVDIINSKNGEGDITIKLTNMKNGDGYTGFTKSITDEGQNQILKSEITIFGVDSLSDEQLATIIRHELGHALGLAHSSAPEDLMSPSIGTDYPYISQCDIDALVFLYDGGKTSQVICEI